MNREQIMGIMKLFKVAYPRFYADMTKEEAENTINLWIDMFKGDNPRLVTMAVKKLITELEFPPTIADVKKAMYSLTDNTVSSIELWNTFLKAISNSGYHSVEEYEKLPDILKKFAGSPMQLRNYAMMDIETVNSVVKGQFLKHIEILKQREKEEKMMLPEARELIKRITYGVDDNTKQLPF